MSAKAERDEIPSGTLDMLILKTLARAASWNSIGACRGPSPESCSLPEEKRG